MGREWNQKAKAEGWRQKAEGIRGRSRKPEARAERHDRRIGGGRGAGASHIQRASILRFSFW